MAADATRVAAIYDIHGNLPALEGVLADVERAGVERIVVGGDVVPGPMPREVIDTLLSLDAPVDFIRGNGEREVLGLRSGAEQTSVPESFREVMAWVGERLTSEQAQLVAGWPLTLTLGVRGLGEVLFCHATPRNDSELFTRRTPEKRLQPVFADQRAAVVICGHTHMQFERTVGAVRIVNAGSVGMPFGEPGAYWLLLGPDIELRCTRYDFAEAAGRIRATDYPQAEEFATRYVLEPPSQAEMIELFERGAAR